MAFNFGQYRGTIVGEDEEHKPTIDTSNYVLPIAITGGDNPVQELNDWIFSFTYQNAATFPAGDFIIEGQIQPQLNKRMQLSIILIKNDEHDSQQIISAQTINKAEEYLSTISTIGTEINIATTKRNEYQNRYNTLASQETYENTIFANAQIPWNEWIDKPDSSKKRDAENTFIEGKERYTEYTINLKAAKNDYEQAEQELNQILEEYSTTLAEIRIPFSHSFYSVNDETYKTIQIKITGEEEIENCPACTINVKQLKEILDTYILHKPLKHIGIQTVEGTKIYINRKELIVGSNNLLEVYNKDLLINSLKIIPQSNFIIDYQY